MLRTLRSPPPNTPARILYLARDWAMDGGERQLFYLLSSLDRSRFEPLVILDRAGPLAAQLGALPVQVEILPLRAWRSFPHALLRYFDAARVTRIAGNRRVNLVHASDPWRNPYAVAIARRLGIPSVVHVRGPLAARDIFKHKLSQASGIIAIAQRYHDDLAAAGIPAERITVIDDAVDLFRFRPLSPLESESNAFRQVHKLGTRVALGLVGRLEPFKRVVEFLEIIHALPATARKNLRCFIIGDPGPDSYMQRVHATMERLGLRDCVIFTGRSDDIPTCMGGLDILATLSGGSVMFEAMASGKTVFSVRADGRPSIHTRHDQTAWCVTTDQAAPAAHALLQLLEDAPLRRRLGSAGRSWVENHLAPALLAERTQSLYERLMAAVSGTRFP